MKIMLMSLLSVMILVGLSCAKKSKSNDDDGDNNDGDGDEATETLAINPLAAAFPQGLELSVFTDEAVSDEDTSGSLSVDDSTSLQLESGFAMAGAVDPVVVDQADCMAYHDSLPATHPDHNVEAQNKCGCSHAHFRTKQEHIKTETVEYEHETADEKNEAGHQRLIGEGQCFDKNIGEIFKKLIDISSNDQQREVLCYEFDWGLEYGYEVDDNKETVSGSDACLVGFTKAQVVAGQIYFDFTNQMAQALLCLAKKGDRAVDLDESDSVDVTDLMSADPKKPDPLTIKEAKVSRLSDQGENKVYRIDISMSNKHEGDAKAMNFAAHTVHSPRNDTNTSYVGKIWLQHDLGGGGGDKPKLHALATPPESTEKFKAVSIKYSATAATDSVPTRLKIELRSANFRIGAKPFGSNGEMNLDVDANSDGTFPGGMEKANDYLENTKYISYDGYPSAGVMNFSYWRNPGGSYNENARGFIFNVKREEDGTIKGCGYAGAGAAAEVGNATSIRKALKKGLTLEPKGYLRPAICKYFPQARIGAKIFRQCFVQKSSGRYVVDAGKHAGGKTFDFIDVDGDSNDLKRPPGPGDFKTPPKL